MNPGDEKGATNAEARFESCSLALKMWLNGYCTSRCVRLPEEPDAETDHHVVEGVEAHHAHQQILQNNLQIGDSCIISANIHWQGFLLLYKILHYKITRATNTHTHQ